MGKLFSSPENYDLIVLGGQEAQMTKKMSIIIEFANYLRQYNFITINSVVMWEMFLVGFVQTEHVPFVKHD